jgi:GT2 family glycosyltransferase
MIAWEHVIGAAPGVSVVIPHRTGKTLLRRILADVASQSLRPLETIVADDGSSDESSAIAAEAGARVVHTGGNGGFSRAVNLGIGAACGELIAIVNNDVELPPAWLATLVAAMSDGEYAFATGKLLQAGHPELIDGTWDALCRGACAWRCGQGRRDGPLWSERREIALAPLTGAVFRRSVFSVAGLLDERFESYLEDVDLGVRCAMAGLRGIYVPEAVARHQGSATLGRWNPDTVRRIARNQLFLAAKYYSADLLLRYAWPLLVSHLLWGVVAARHGAGWAYAKGKWAGIRRFRSIRPVDCTPGDALRRLLTTGEREILELQRSSGFDPYWKFYFALT